MDAEDDDQPERAVSYTEEVGSGLTKQIICARTNDDLFNFAAGFKADDRPTEAYTI